MHELCCSLASCTPAGALLTACVLKWSLHTYKCGVGVYDTGCCTICYELRCWHVVIATTTLMTACQILDRITGWSVLADYQTPWLAHVNVCMYVILKPLCPARNVCVKLCGYVCTTGVAHVVLLACCVCVILKPHVACAWTMLLACFVCTRRRLAYRACLEMKLFCLLAARMLCWSCCILWTTLCGAAECLASRPLRWLWSVLDDCCTPWLVVRIACIPTTGLHDW